MGARWVSRRAVLTGIGVTALGVAGAAVVTGALPGGAPMRRLVSGESADPGVPDVPPAQVRIERLASSARGCAVDLAVMTPQGVAAEGLAVCLVLHGRGSSARGVVDLGLPHFLTAALRSGVAPFALVAPDGGDSYWHGRDPGDDPQAMLREELPGWLTARGLAHVDDGHPRATLGISMGAFGELAYARARAGSRPLRAIAAVSPAVFGSWEAARVRRVFRDRADWEATEPLRHLDAVAGQPLGVWCGTEDPFVGAARQLARDSNAAVSAFTTGAHTVRYWHRVLPDVLRFAGGQLSGA